MRAVGATNRRGDWSSKRVTDMASTATFTLLMARSEGSARLWQTKPRETAAALPWLRASTSHLVTLHDGILSPGHGDSFIAMFGRPADALACALALQLAPSDPFSLCIGVHEDDVAAARLRDIATGGQTLISGAAAAAAADELPCGATLKDLGRHRVTADAEQLAALWHPGLTRHRQPLCLPDQMKASQLGSARSRESHNT